MRGTILKMVADRGGAWMAASIGILACGIAGWACSFDTSGLRTPGVDGTVTQHDGGLPGDARTDAATGPDTDGDGHPDSTDNCVEIPNPGQEDGDLDGVGDVCDNCPSHPNPQQENLDGDPFGDLCDGDRDNDTLPNTRDPFPDSANQVAYFSELEISEQHFWWFGGAWDFPGNGAFCQSDETAGVARSHLDAQYLAATDYLAETLVTVVNYEIGAWETLAGIAFRVPDVGPGAFDGYVCAINPEDRSLDFLSLENDVGTYVANSPMNSVPATGPFHLRITADGDAITCELLPGGPLLQVTRSDHSVGTIGFFTHHSAACFEYLVVIGL